MENNEMMYLKAEMNQLRDKNEKLSTENNQLKHSLHFNRSFNEMSAKLLAIEYIVRSSEYSIDRKALCSILGITLSEEA